MQLQVLGGIECSVQPLRTTHTGTHNNTQGGAAVAVGLCQEVGLGCGRQTILVHSEPREVHLTQ